MDHGAAGVSFSFSQIHGRDISSRCKSLINSDNAAVEEEVYYEQPGPKRKVKVPPLVPRRPEL